MVKIFIKEQIDITSCDECLFLLGARFQVLRDLREDDEIITIGIRGICVLGIQEGLVGGPKTPHCNMFIERNVVRSLVAGFQPFS